MTAPTVDRTHIDVVARGVGSIGDAEACVILTMPVTDAADFCDIVGRLLPDVAEATRGAIAVAQGADGSVDDDDAAFDDAVAHLDELYNGL